MTDKLTAAIDKRVLELMEIAGMWRAIDSIRDEAARREAVDGKCPDGKCRTSDTLGTCLPGACLFPDAPPPPADDLVARLNMLHAKHHFKPADEKTIREAAAAIEALRADLAESARVISRWSEMYAEMETRAEAAEARVAALEGALNIDAMVSRFLSWRLPDTFNPDGHIRFDKSPDARGNPITWPVGTNLFSYEEAVKMVRHMLAEDSANG